MLIRERMSKPVITIHQDISMQNALNLMRKEHIRRFPVLDNHGRLIGIVSSSDETSLSVNEVNYLLSKITVEEVMSKNVITVTEGTPLEEAARKMTDNEISACL